MNLTKQQWQRVGGIMLTALLAIAAVLGWYFPVEAPEARVRERISIDARDDAFLYNGADLYVYSNDHTTQKLHIDGATGNIDGEGTLDVAGGILSASGFVTFTDGVIVDGAADVVQLTVQGYTTQTSHIFVVEETGATDLFWVTNDGDSEFNGTTPTLTMGDAGEEDTGLVFDGNAQDFYIALDDTADDFLIGLGSAVGTTPGFALDENLAVTTYGDVTMGGTTPVLTVGDAAEEDAALVFDGDAQDFYVALDDTADDLLIGLGSAVGTTGVIFVDENQDVGIGAASAGAKLDVTGNTLLVGAADEVQLQITGFTTQTSNILLLEETGGADLFWITNDGDSEFNGTTPTLTMGDADEEDTGFVFDGNAQDFYIALDDTADDLIIGLGSAVGTTPGFGLDENLAVALYGDVTMNGTTPVLTVGDADEEDTTVLFDGNAQDFYVALDDTADDLIIGLGSAVGTTPILSMDENRVVTVDTDLIVDDVFGIDDTAYTSVGAQTLSPTASFYTLAPTSVLTLTLGTTGVNAGDIVLFVSTVTTGTTIVDTTATAGGGDRALGENDFIGFVYTGSVWAEAFYSDNS